MFLLNFGVLVLALIALVHSQTQFHLTPGISSVEQYITAGQQLCSLEDLRNAIGIPSPFTLEVDQTSDQASNGLRRQKLRIMYDGILVRVVKLQASIDDDDCYTGAVSGYYPTNFPANFDVSPTRTVSELRATVVNYMDANDIFPPFVTGVTDAMLEHFSQTKEIIIDRTNGLPTLAYHVRGLVDVGGANGAYIRFPRSLIRVSDLTPLNVDLVVLKESAEKTKCVKATGGNEKFPGNVYGPGNNRVCLNALQNGKTCTYENDDVIIMTVENSYDRDTAQTVSFKCSKGPDDESNGGFSPSSDAFYFSQVFYKMLKKWTGLTNTNTEPLKMFVHFGEDYPNSFFDGKSVTFGDGTIHTHPVAVQEIIGHELGHTMTDTYGNLQLNIETLALNEAFSDICGKAVSVYEGDLEWTFAKRFPRVETALRYFDNPPLDGLAIDHLNDFNPANGVYSIMGIFTKFMHTIVVQENMRFRDAFQTIVFANQIYWNEESSIIDGACGVMRAASDLALDTQAFADAFNVVGIDLAFCELNGTRDAIVYQPGLCDLERQPIVSQARNPTYVIRATPGLTNVQVSVTPANPDITIFTEANGNTVSYPGNSVDITMGSEDIVVGVKSDKVKASTESINFHFN